MNPNSRSELVKDTFDKYRDKPHFGVGVLSSAKHMGVDPPVYVFDQLSLSDDDVVKKYFQDGIKKRQNESNLRELIRFLL